MTGGVFRPVSWTNVFFKLSKHFGWTPEQIGNLTISQIHVYLKEIQTYEIKEGLRQYVQAGGDVGKLAEDDPRRMMWEEEERERVEELEAIEAREKETFYNKLEEGDAKQKIADRFKGGEKLK